jgi:hypothetical protein
MSKFMKKLLTVLALTGCAAANAAGPIDGIYSCSVSLNGSAIQSYVTINGQPDGSSIFAVAAVNSSQPFYGYGIGMATRTSYYGDTMFGSPFNFTVNPSTLAFTGTIGVLWYGRYVNAAAICSKIY